jgi:hypothetical protein
LGYSLTTLQTSHHRQRALLLVGLLSLFATVARANGRIPGATGLAFNPTDEQQLLLGLTYGLALSRDGGGSWTWMCERQIEGNGGDVDPSIVVSNDGTLVVLSLTNGGVLWSRDDGCSFERAQGPLQGNRGVDLTLDPSQPGRVLALTSTITEIVDAGFPRFRNLLAQSLDHGVSWEILAELPDDLSAETVEVAPSDGKRIYVSGTANEDPLQGLVLRSDDAGRTWQRSSVRLPRGSGSLFLSGIHPRDPDRLWFRVPGLGDIYGVLPAKLWLSTDGAVSFDQVAETTRGMLGFAVSPDGDRIAYGGPLDGLFIAPADASATPEKVAELRVGCLRWQRSGLYVCAGEPSDPYSLGFAAEPTQGFVPLWHRANTCRAGCGAPSTLERNCREPWEMLAPLTGAETALCADSSFAPDGGVDAGYDATAGPRPSDSGVAAVQQPPKQDAGRCALTHAHASTTPWWLPPSSVCCVALRYRRRRKLHVSARAHATKNLSASTTLVHRQS